MWTHSIACSVSVLTGFDYLYYLTPFAPGHFAEKRVLRIVERFSGHCHVVKS